DVEPVGRVDPRVPAGRPRLGAVRGIAHDDPDPAPDPEVDLGGRRLPAAHAVEPAAKYLLARPGLEDALGRRAEGPLDSQHPLVMTGHLGSSRYAPTTSKRRSQRVR